MPSWHVNEGLAPCIDATKLKYPGIVVYTIGDEAHRNRKSDHNPNKYNRVNAADYMIGPAFSPADAFEHSRLLVLDDRTNYVIYNREINNCDGNGWVDYDGDDPHTNHVHHSVNDSAHTDDSEWNLGGKVNGMALPKYGDKGEDVSYWQLVHNLTRDAHGDSVPAVDVDGDYGPGTASALALVYKRLTGRTDYNGKVLSHWMAVKLHQALIRVTVNPTPVKKGQ